MSPPAIWTPDDLEKLLKGAPADLVPVLAIGAFAGLRTSELLRLEWNEVDLERGLIEVKADKAKSARRRLVKIEPNLRAWLAPYAGSAGPGVAERMAILSRGHRQTVPRAGACMARKWSAAFVRLVSSRALPERGNARPPDGPHFRPHDLRPLPRGGQSAGRATLLGDRP